MANISFPHFDVSAQAEALRREVREFLATELRDRSPLARAQSWNGLDPEFSRRVGQRGWIGMTWPKQFGGAARSAFERYVVMEEMLAAGAPVAAHWIADRQSGPGILRYGSERQKEEILPRIARGDCYFCLGMSESSAGSDLAAVRTRAQESRGGYIINGSKLWTTNAHIAHFMTLLCRTDSVAGSNRHGGLSQFIVDMSLPGIIVRPIHIPSGEHHFNEVIFNEVFVPADALLGQRGEGWRQVMSELAYERSGPERFLSSFALFAKLVEELGAAPSERAAVAIGRLAAHLVTLRRMSRSVAGALEGGEDPSLQAAMVKDLGAVLEQEIPEIARSLVATEPTLQASDQSYEAVLGYTMMHAPSFSLRGGTREILRGIIARGLGVK